MDTLPRTQKSCKLPLAFRLIPNSPERSFLLLQVPSYTLCKRKRKNLLENRAKHEDKAKLEDEANQKVHKLHNNPGSPHTIHKAENHTFQSEATRKTRKAQTILEKEKEREKEKGKTEAKEKATIAGKEIATEVRAVGGHLLVAKHLLRETLRRDETQKTKTEGANVLET